MNETNPFQSPVAVAEEIIPEAELEMVPFHPGASIAKWLTICAISGAPSFFFGFMLGEMRPAAAIAMLAGIVTFAVMYTLVESTQSVRRKLTERRLKRAVWIGYGTRILISIVYPMCIYVDVVCGMISVGIGTSLFGIEVGPMSGDPEAMVDKASSIHFFAQFYFTTLVQGVMLNLILGAYTLIVYAICMATMKKNPLAL